MSTVRKGDGWVPRVDVDPAVSSGWTHDHPIVHLTHVADTVAIGAAAMEGAEKVRIVGGLRLDHAAGNSAYLELTQGQSAAVSPAGTGRFRYNVTTNQMEVSENGGGYVPVLATNDLAVANLTALGALADGPLADGSPCMVLSLMALWELRKTGTDAADGITIVNTASGVGRWYRVRAYSQYWQKRTTWYVAYTSGNDENPGTLASPIKTLAEWGRRIGSYLDNSSAVTVYITEDLTQTDPFKLPRTRHDTGTYPLRFIGARTALYSGSVTGYQAQNIPANTEPQLTDAAVGDWAVQGLVGKQLVMTSGAANGAIGWPLNAMGAGNNTTRMRRLFHPTTFADLEPGIGDTFTVYQLTRIIHQGFLSDEPSYEVGFYNLAIEGTNPFISTLHNEVEGESLLIGCSLKSGKIFVLGGIPWYCGCLFHDLTDVMVCSGEFIVWSCCAINTRFLIGYAFGAPVAQLYPEFVAQGSGNKDFICVSDGGFLDLQGAIGCWGYGTGTPLRLRNQGRVTVSYGGRVWGVTGAPYAVRVESGSCFVYDPAALPVMTGATVADSLVGGVAKNWADWPFVMGSKEAAVIDG